MKTTIVALVLAALVGCGKDKAKAATTTPSTPASPAAQVEQKQLETDEQVSPNLAVSGDILAACGITAVASANPKFEYDETQLTPEDRTILDQIATCLTTGALQGKAVSLIGRADPRGTDEYNLGLGSRRAQSVSDYLTRLGVSEPQLAVSTRGAIDATGSDEAGWAEDRRVDIQLRN